MPWAQHLSNPSHHLLCVTAYPLPDFRELELVPADIGNSLDRSVVHNRANTKGQTHTHTYKKFTVLPHLSNALQIQVRIHFSQQTFWLRCNKKTLLMSAVSSFWLTDAPRQHRDTINDISYTCGLPAMRSQHVLNVKGLECLNGINKSMFISSYCRFKGNLFF